MSFSSRQIILLTLIILGLTVYIFGSIWLITASVVKTNCAAQTTVCTLPGLATPSAQSLPLPDSSSAHFPLFMTPTPLQGPGQYACSSTGDCADFSEAARKTCPVTFADRHCLNQCADPVKRCKQ